MVVFKGQEERDRERGIKCGRHSGIHGLFADVFSYRSRS